MLVCASARAENEPDEDPSDAAEVVPPKPAPVDVRPKQRPHFELVLRSGYAVPAGSLSYPTVKTFIGGSIDVAQRMSDKVPLAVEAGIRFPNVFVGAFVDIGQVRPLCGTGYCGSSQAAGNDVILGFAGQFHPWPGSIIDPWVGVGWGFESLPGVGQLELTCSCKGLTGLATIGIDVRVGDYLAIGPFVMASSSLLVGGGDGSIFQPASGWDTWLSVGGRVVGDFAGQWRQPAGH